MVGLYERRAHPCLIVQQSWHVGRAVIIVVHTFRWAAAVAPKKLKNIQRPLFAVGSPQDRRGVQIGADCLRVGVGVNTLIDDGEKLVGGSIRVCFTPKKILAAKKGAAGRIEEFAIEVADDLLGHARILATLGETERIEAIGQETRLLAQKLFAVRLYPVCARGGAKIAAVFVIIDRALSHPVERQANVIEISSVFCRRVAA